MESLFHCEATISTNELVRRAKATGLCSAAHHREAIELERAKAARDAANRICEWPPRHRLPASYRKQIIEEVHCEVAERELDESLSQRPNKIELSMEELIQRCTPSMPADDNASAISWYHE